MSKLIDMFRTGIKPFAWEELAFVEGADNYTWLRFSGPRRDELSSRSMWYICKHMPRLLRIHRSYAVNPAHVLGVGFVYCQYGKRYYHLVLRDGGRLPLAPNRVINVLARLGLPRPEVSEAEAGAKVLRALPPP